MSVSAEMVIHSFKLVASPGMTFLIAARYMNLHPDNVS